MVRRRQGNGFILARHDGRGLHRSSDTREWQLGRLYFEILANSLARFAAFAPTQIPISYYRSSTDGRPAPCTLHVDLESVQVYLTGIKGPNSETRVHLDCFAEDPSSKRYARLRGYCSVLDAERFGQELLQELESVKEYDDTDGRQPRV
jgi:hypothetical protein